MDEQLNGRGWLGSVVRRLEPWGPGLYLLIVLAGWEGLARGGGLSSTFFPPPSSIATALARLLVGGEIAAHTGITLTRVLAGFGLGAGPGLLLGLAMGASPRLHRQLDPLVAAGHPVPKIAVLPLILVVFGIGESSKVALAALGAFFPMVINAVAGVRQISPVHFEVARSCGAGAVKLLTRVILPGSLPLLFTGARLSLNVALMLTIAGELIAAQRGLGQLMWFAWQTMRVEEVYAGLAVIGMLGITLNFLLERLARSAMPWHRPETRSRPTKEASWNVVSS